MRIFIFFNVEYQNMCFVSFEKEDLLSLYSHFEIESSTMNSGERKCYTERGRRRTTRGVWEWKDQVRRRHKKGEGESKRKGMEGRD